MQPRDSPQFFEGSLMQRVLGKTTWEPCSSCQFLIGVIRGVPLDSPDSWKRSTVFLSCSFSTKTQLRTLDQRGHGISVAWEFPAFRT